MEKNTINMSRRQLGKWKWEKWGKWITIIQRVRKILTRVKSGQVSDDLAPLHRACPDI